MTNNNIKNVKRHMTNTTNMYIYTYICIYIYIITKNNIKNNQNHINNIKQHINIYKNHVETDKKPYNK